MARDEEDFEEIDLDAQQLKLQKELEARDKKFLEFTLDDWRMVLTTPAGRAVMGQIMVFCRTLEANLEGNQQAMAFREGLRAAGLYTMDHVRKAAPGKYLDVLREAEAVAGFFKTAKISELSQARDLFYKKG